MLFIILFFFEFGLRQLGFGYPILYENQNNYYPKTNQKMKRFKGNKFLINNHGMRTNYDWNNVKDKYKILFFGDSVTFGGSYIDNKDLFSEKLCKIIENSVCGNYAVNGYKTSNISLRIKDISEKISYDHLIIVVSDSIKLGHSDFNDFPFYELYKHKLFRSIFEILNHILFKYHLKDNYHTDKFKINQKEPDNFSEFIRTLQNTNKKNIKVNIFILPTLENLNAYTYEKHFLEKLGEENLYVHNMYKEFKDLDYNSLYFNNAHLNKKGHDYFAKLLYDEIK